MKTDYIEYLEIAYYKESNKISHINYREHSHFSIDELKTKLIEFNKTNKDIYFEVIYSDDLFYKEFKFLALQILERQKYNNKLTIAIHDLENVLEALNEIESESENDWV